MKDYKNKNNSIFTQYNDEPENTIYRTSILTIILLCISYILGIILKSFFPVFDIFSSCFIKHFFDIPCPGCGGTRSVICFFKGQWLKSIYFNAFGFYFSLIYSIFFVTQTLKRLTNNRTKGLKWNDIYIKLGIVILFIQYILKLCIPYLSIGI